MHTEARKVGLKQDSAVIVVTFLLFYFRPLKWDDNNQDYPQVEAESNFWGFGNPAGRIWDRKDDDNLIGVQFEPFYTKNTSVLQGLFRYLTC